MSRLAAYIDKDDMERRDVAELIADDAVDLKQYRYIGDEEDNIFRKGNRALRYVRTVKGRIDRRQNVKINQAGEVTKSIDHTFVLTIYGRDVKVNDVFRYDGIDYIATYTFKVGSSFSEVEAEVAT